MVDEPKQTDTQNPDRETKPRLPEYLEEERLAEIQDQKERFLLQYSEQNTNIKKACFAADLQRYQIARWRDQDPEFARRMDAIKEGLTDDIEDNLAEMALSRDREDVPAGAKIRAIEIWLKANRSEKYNPKIESGGNNVQVNIILGSAPKAGKADVEIINPDDATANDEKLIEAQIVDAMSATDPDKTTKPATNGKTDDKKDSEEDDN